MICILYPVLPVLGHCIKEDELDEACNTLERDEETYRILVGIFERKKPLGTSRCRCENNFRTDLYID
jgi:hypothetical protein